MTNGLGALLAVLSFAFALACGADVIAAQEDVPLLRFATPEAGTLGSSSFRLGSWDFSGAAGQVVDVEVIASGFSPVLALRSPAGDVIAVDLENLFTPEPDPQDYPYIQQVLEGLNLDPDEPAGILDLLLDHRGRSGQGVARVVAALPVGGTYRVQVASARTPGENSYEIELRPLSSEVLLAQGQPGDGTLRADGSGVAVWEFTGGAGQVVSVAAGSEEFDTVVELRDSTGQRLARDDDGGPRSDSRILATLPANGLYQVWVFTYDDGVGSYRVAVTARNARPLNVTGDAPTTTVGELGTEGTDLTGLAAWGFDGEANQVVNVTVRSDHFDTVLELRSSAGERLARDDDGGPDSDSQLTAVLPENGRYQLWVTAYDSRNGTYALTVDIEDGREPDDGVWEFAGRPNEVARVTAASAAFDTVVQLLTPTGEELARDDDGGPGSDSELIAILRDEGRYWVRVSAVDGEASGPYEVAVDIVTPERLTVDAPEPSAGSLLEAPGIGAWSFSGMEGQVVGVRARATDFDTMVELRSPDGESVAEDDDGGPGTDSELVATLEETGTYHVWVSAFGEGSGPYTVAVRTIDPVQPQRLDVGEPRRGTLDAEQSEIEVWVLDEGEVDVVRVVVRVVERSDEFDIDVELFGQESGRIVRDTDGTSDSEAEFTAIVGGGAHEIRVASHGAGVGTYEIEAMALSVGTLRSGDVGTGTLGPGSERTER